MCDQMGLGGHSVDMLMAFHPIRVVVSGETWNFIVQALPSVNILLAIISTNLCQSRGSI